MVTTRPTSQVPATGPHDGSRPQTEGVVIFVSGFHARATVREYVHHLLMLRPGLCGRVQQFSCRDDPDGIAKQVAQADGPVTLVGNSLGAATAAAVAVQSRRVHTLMTLAPVGSLQVDFGAIATSVSAWINLKTPAGIADVVALSLSQGQIGPWGYGPEPHATRFIDSPLGHAEFWPQMDAVAAMGFGI
jgi:pimeloyl-ACP methyl ester carboxylesterase